ncbi:MAG TPA: hypothetical protein VF189_02175 [Patescibacteria group bacterium]
MTDREKLFGGHEHIYPAPKAGSHEPYISPVWVHTGPIFPTSEDTERTVLLAQRRRKDKIKRSKINDGE